MAFAISVEDPDNIDVVTTGTTFAGFAPTGGGGALPVFLFTTSTVTQDKSDIPNLQAYLMYSSDAFSAQIVGLVQDDEFGSTDWAVGGVKDSLAPPPGLSPARIVPPCRSTTRWQMARPRPVPA